ncbi:MAG: epoxyqueuosine reductase QueH [Clostridia bacterium]|nr:epoxyqueuosine reductase QueH [Clostridia bacterium]
MKLLMHACCAPCSVYCVDTLRKEGIEPTLYWFNPNIHPYTEYTARRDCLKEYSKIMSLETIFEEDYGLDEFCKNVIDDIDTRCTKYCYPVRLERTFQYAKENGYDTVTTTLLYSIYQNHDYIKFLCEKYSKEYGIDFLYRNFREGFWVGHDKAKNELNLYMQKYCGCIFSEEDRYNNSNSPRPVLPDNFEFLQTRRSIVIKKEKENKEQYMDLLLEADPEKEVIQKYLKDGELFVLIYKDKITCVAVVTRIDDNICELKNIATEEQYRGKGFGKKLIQYLFENYKNTYDKMIVGTTENNIPFYIKQGFDRYEKTIKNFFVDHYNKEIWDGDLHCIDMYYYSKDLKKEKKYK